MYRLVRVRANSGVATPLSAVYKVTGGRCISQFRQYLDSYNSSVTSSGMSYVTVFKDAIVLDIPSSVDATRYYCFEIDIPYPQSVEESVFEKSNKPVVIEVFNENNVLICSYGLTTSDAPHKIGTGDKTSEITDVTVEEETGVIDGGEA